MGVRQDRARGVPDGRAPRSRERAALHQGGLLGRRRPYSADGRYFTRAGTSNKALSTSELSATVIKRERARSPWDSQPSGRPVSDADERAVRDFVEHGGRVRRVGGGFAGVKGALARLDLVAPDGNLRNAAVELLCEGSDT